MRRMLKLTDFVLLGILLLLVAALIIKIVRQDEDRRTHYVLLFLRLVSREAPEDRVVTLRKFVYLRALPSVGFTINGQGVDELPIARVELEASDVSGVRDKTPACIIHFGDCPIETERLDRVSKALQDDLGWQYLPHRSG
jgi:hypothetical protein